MRSAIFCALLFASAARASTTVTDEISVNNTQSTPQNPRSGNFSNLLGASFDLGERWTLNASGLITVEGQTPAPTGVAFRDRGGTVADFSVGVDWDATENFSFGLALDFSPKTTVGTAAELTVDDGSGTISSATTLVRATNSNSAIDLLAGYDTAGDSDLEWSFSAGVSFSRYQTTQQIAAVQVGKTVLTTAQLQALCALPRSNCPRALLQALDATSDELRSVHGSVGVTATLYTDTDLTLGADYYYYGDDPTQAGYFSVGTIGHGAGMAIAPLRYLVRPEIAHRFGDLQVKLWGQAGEYVSRTGQSTGGGGLKVQYKFTKDFKLWATASGQRDVDASGQISRSGTVSLGAAFRF